MDDWHCGFWCGAGLILAWNAAMLAVDAIRAKRRRRMETKMRAVLAVAQGRGWVVLDRNNDVVE